MVSKHNFSLTNFIFFESNEDSLSSHHQKTIKYDEMQLQSLNKTMHVAKYSVRYLHLPKLPEKKREYLARKLIGFSNEEMYLVVADVKCYNQFLPFCTKSTILNHQPKELIANLEIGFPPIVENYTSTVTLDRPNLVRAVCRDGRLFNCLETIWKFSPGLESNPKSCIIDFHIKFEFKSLLHSQLASMFFDRLVQQMENAFINEAKRRYGRESLPSHELSPIKS